MAGNYTQDDVDEMMTKASAEADERVRTVQEQADKAMAAAAEEADAKVLAVQNELANVRRVLADERKQKDEEVRIATEKAARKAWASVNAAINEAVDRSTADLRGQLERPVRTCRPRTARSTRSRMAPTTPPSSPTLSCPS